MSRLDSHLRIFYRGLKVAFVFSFFINLLMLVVPVYSLQLFTRVLTSQSLETLIMLSGITVFLLIVQSLIDLSRNHIVSATGINFSQSLAPQLLSHSIKEQAHNSQAKSQEAIKQLSDVRNTLTSSAVYGLFDLPWAPIFLLAMFLIHPWLGWIAIGGAATLLVIGILTSWYATKQELITQTTESQNHALAQKYTEYSTSVMALGLLNSVINRWKTNNQTLLVLNAKSSKPITNLSIITKLFRMLLQVSVMGLAVYLALIQEVSAGAVIAASIIMSRSLAPFEQAVTYWKHWKKGLRSFKQLKRVIQSNDDKEATITLPEPKGKLSTSALFFTFPNSNEPFLKNINLKFEPGTLYGLIGSSGSGKSTLGKILLGCNYPSNGQVTLDGADVHQWLDQGLGKHLGYLSQDVQLLPGTVAENIGRFETDNSEDIIKTAQLVGIHDMILSLPLGYETPIGFGGMELSGGQQQRIGLARALYKSPKVIVLDEPNANMDPESELKLIKALQTMRDHGSCIILITHKPSIIAQTNQLVVLNAGEVVKQGPTAEIMNSAKQELTQKKSGVANEQA